MLEVNDMVITIVLTIWLELSFCLSYEMVIYANLLRIDAKHIKQIISAYPLRLIATSTGHFCNEGMFARINHDKTVFLFGK